MILGLLIPLIGTTIGSALVFLMGKNITERWQKILNGFAGGIMVSASFFSLIIPGIELNQSLGKFAAFPVTIGFLIGMGFLLLMDSIIPHIHFFSNEVEGSSKKKLSKTLMMTLAVSIHNLPEGMAVGSIIAGMLSNQSGIELGSVMVLVIGIAIQNLPEGAIISLNLKAEGKSKFKSFLAGFLSGIVEPIGSLVMIFLSSIFSSILPYMLGFAAGAMIYVCVEEIIPEMNYGKHSNLATVFFGIGFAVMLILDVTLG